MSFGYQKEAKKFLDKNKIGAIFLDVGMGKTKIILDKINDIVNENKKVLIIAPLQVAKAVWNKEAKKFYPNLKITICTGSREEKERKYKEPHEVLVINREYTEDFYSKGLNFLYDCTILDESSSFKSKKANRTKYVLRTTSEYRYILSATPFQLVEELWTQFYFLDKGERLGCTLKTFYHNYFDTHSLPMRGRYISVHKLKEGMKDVIFSKIQDIIFSVENTHDLKVKYNYIRFDINPDIRKLYNNLLKESVLLYKDEPASVVDASSKFNKLSQICNGAVYKEDGKEYEILHYDKVKELKELIKSIKGNVIIVYKYRFDIELIKKEIPDLVLYNSDVVDDWNAGKIKVLAIHPKSAGHGINLQHGGNDLIWFSLTYSLEEYKQTNGRLIRPGQKNTVNIHIMICERSIESNIKLVLEGKESIVSYFNNFILDNLDSN